MRRNNMIVPYSICNWLLLLVFCLQFVVSYGAKNIWGILSSKPLDEYGYILVVELLAIALPTLLVCFYGKTGFRRTFEVRKLKSSKLWKCVGLGICLQPVAVIANMPLQRLVSVETASVSAPDNITQILTMLLFACVIPAFCEEFLLRGMLLTSVKRKGYAFTIIVTSVMFVLMHADISTAIGHLVLGVAAAYVVLNTYSVFAGVMVHMSFNLGGIMIDYIVSNYYVPGGFVGTFNFFAVIGAIGLILSVLLLRGLYNPKTKKAVSKDLIPNLFKAFFNIPILVIIVMYVLRIVV